MRRYAARWKESRRKDFGDGVTAFIPLMFGLGEAYQFDWSREDVEIAGAPMRVKLSGSSYRMVADGARQVKGASLLHRT